MPGLLRGVARTAVVAGTATAVSNRVSRRQANRWSTRAEPAQYGEPAPTSTAPPPAARAAAPAVHVEQLAALREQDIPTDAKLADEKAELLGI